MWRIAIIVIEWLLKNAVQRVLLGAGLSLVSYTGIMTAVRYAFNNSISSIYSIPGTVLALMGLYGIDHVISTLVSVGLFVLTLNQGKLALRRKL